MCGSNRGLAFFGVRDFCCAHFLILGGNMSNSSLAKQLRVFGIVLFILGIVGSIWSGVEMIDMGQELLGVIILIAGPVLSYVSFLVLWSIASLLDTTELIHGNSYDMRAVRDVVTGDNALVYKKNEEEPKKIVIEEDREMALRKALAEIECGDILMVLGKGHEEYQIIKDEHIECSDKKMIYKWLQI